MNSIPDNNKTDKESRVTYFTVPGDVIMDILYILFSNNIHYSINSVNRNQNSILLDLPMDKQPPVLSDAIENIDGILQDYNQYLSGIPNKAPWEQDESLL
jgi:hypothetical protein